MATTQTDRPGHRKTRYGKVSQVADLSRPTIYRLMRNGDLRNVKMGGARRIDWADVDAYAESCVV